jgi:hypothetical protein
MLCLCILIRLSCLYFIVLLGLGFWESLFCYFIRFRVLGVFMSYFIRYRGFSYKYILIASKKRGC